MRAALIHIFCCDGRRYGSAFRRKVAAMRVFVTGATGLIGLAVVNDLIAAGHQVTGLARSDASAKKLTDAGAKALRGDIEDLDVLRKGAAATDGVIHTTFCHEISHLPLGTRFGVFLGGLPTGIVKRFLKAVLEADRRALETMGGVFVGTDRPLVGTFGTLAMKSGSVATEDQPYDPRSAGAQRGGTEATMHQLASRGVRVPPSCACRLSCMVRTIAMALSRYSSRSRGRRRSQPTLVKVTIAGELCTSWTQRACSGWRWRTVLPAGCAVLFSAAR